MSQAGRRPPHPPLRRAGPVLVTLLAAACVAWAAVSTWHDSLAVGAGIVAALWTLPAIVPLHLLQLLLSALAWRRLFPPRQGRPGLATFTRLRIMREGIDSLLPVAQVGGEVIAAGRLARHGIGLGRAGASLVVDLTVEVVTQLLFLILGLAVLAARTGHAGGAWFVELTVLGLAAAAGLLAAQRFGLLRLLEALLRRIAERFPALAGASPDGLHSEALAFYRQPGLPGAAALHFLAWLLGTVETWLVLQALGVTATPLQCLVVESLGMAARSAGFAVPGAAVIQEGGFMLAAVAAGLPAAPALALSLIKRLRELIVGLLGLTLWHSRRA